MKIFVYLTISICLATTPAFSESVTQERDPTQAWIESYRASLEGKERDYFDGILIATNACLAETLFDVHKAAGSFSSMVEKGPSAEQISTDLVAICYNASRATLKRPTEMRPLLEAIHKNQLLPFALQVISSMVAKGQ